MNRNIVCTFAFFTILALALPIAAEDEIQGWPRVLEGKDFTITMYQPQLDTWRDDDCEARAAVSIKNGDKAPVFGAVWINARFEVDLDTRLVHFSEIVVPTVAFPESSEGEQKALAAYLEREIPKWDMSFSLDRILPMLETAETNQTAAVQLKNTPPEIIVKHEPAVLVIIDGEPKLQDIEDSKLKRVVNTPYVIVKSEKKFYLATDSLWYTASDISGPWKTTTKLPVDVAKIDEALKKQQEEYEQPPADETEDDRLAQPSGFRLCSAR